MRYVALSTLLALVVAVCPVSAEECCQAKLKATQDKIAAVLASWKEVSGKLAAQCPVERAQIEAEFTAAAKTCPVGSRMGKTLAFVRGALAQSIQADEACKASCAKSGEEKAAASCEQTAVLMAARSKLLGDLHSLASYATGQAPACEKAAAKETAAAAKGFCPDKAAKLAAAVRGTQCEKEGAEILIKGIEGLKCEKKAAEIAAAVRGTACAEEAAAILVKAAGECAAACAREGKEVAAGKETAVAAKEAVVCKETCAAGGACCKDAQGCAEALAAEAKNLKASWAKAKEEMTSLTAEQRQQLAATVEKLSSRNEAFKLMPQTIQALAEGVETLAGMNGHLLKMAEANPELIKSIPEKVFKNFQAQAGLISETSEILKLASGAACGASACEKEGKPEKTVSVAE